MKHSSNVDNVNDLYDHYVKELDGFLNWALSNLNKYRDELLDVGFVVYLELFIRLFKKSTKMGKQFVEQFRDVFDPKFHYYIDKISQYKFVDQLDELTVLNVGYNRNNKLNGENPSKYVMVLSSNCMRTLKNWLNIYNNSVVNVILLERMEVIDSEMINQNSVSIFKRYFLTKYGIDIEHIYTNYKYGQPYLGLYIKDVELNRAVSTSSMNTNNLLVDNFKDNKILYGLPCEIYSNDYGNDINSYTLGVSGEYTKMEDCRKLIPLPKSGSLVHDSLRSLYQLQYSNRNLNDKNLYILNYNFCNVNNINCGAISDFDGRYVSAGLRDGTILLYDLVKSQCENAYDDISCIIGDDISYKTVNNIYPLYYSNDNGNDNRSSNRDNKDNNKTNNNNVNVSNNLNKSSNMIINSHDGLVNCLKFGENGQVLLSGGIDSLIKLYVVNSIGSPESGNNNTNNSNNSNVKCVNYYNGTNDSNSSNLGSNNTSNSNNNNNVNKNNGVVNIDYSKYGYYFSTVDMSGYCKLWATDRSYPIRYFKLFTTNFVKNRFHPNSSLLSMLCDNNIVKLYDLRSNDNVMNIDTNLDFYGTFTSNSSNLGSNNTNKNNNSGNLNRVNKDKNRDKGRDVNISKNGIILSVYVYNQLLLYDIRTNKLFERINVHSGNINSVDFSYSTNLLSVTDNSGVLSLWSFNNYNTYIYNTDPNLNNGLNNDRDSGVNSSNKVGGTDYKSGLLTDQKSRDGSKNLINAYRYNGISLLGGSFTPENVLLTLGLSSL